MAAGDRRRDYFRNLCRRSAVDNKPFSGHLLVAFLWAQYGYRNVKGRKGGSSSSRTPTEQPDDLQSVAKAKSSLRLGREFAGQLTGKDIYLDGTALENADGSQNFSGVTWEFRAGTQAQKYIQGIPGTENEISVGTEVSSATAWTRTFTNTQLSAVRLRLKWPSLFKQEDDGDLVGNSVNYAIDLQTDGGTWKTVLNTSVTGKTTSGYERSHRIDLPQAGSTWTIRLRKITADANSAKIGDTMTLQSFTEVIDAKLRYRTPRCYTSNSTPASSMALSRRFPASRVAASSVYLMFMILKRGLTAAHGPGRLSGRGRITLHGFFTIWLYLTVSGLGTA
jgi:hypothetical protein